MSTDRDQPYNVLFLCTGNSARSIMAEALLTLAAPSRFKAYSAGSRPAGAVHPLTLDTLKGAGLSVQGLRSKSWDEFALPEAPRMDFVITVCDHAAGEVCPVWPGQPITAHWGFEDPVAFEGSQAQRRALFAQIMGQLSRRLQTFVSLPLEKLDRLAIQREVQALGRVTPELA